MAIRFQKLLQSAQNCRNEFLRLGPQNIEKLDKSKEYKNLAQNVFNIKKQDFNISDEFFTQNNIHMYSSSNLFETQNFDICFGLFILPKGYYIPMHDHPSMYVITKILHGSARKLSYDIADKSQIKHQFLYPQTVQKALNKNDQQQIENLQNPIIKVDKQFDNVVSEGMLDVVRPQQGNLHAFYASEDQDFIFLNCFIPHYDEKTRFTNFYDIQDEISQVTEAVMLPKAPEEYKKKIVTLDQQQMPFFQDQASQKAFEDCKKGIHNSDCLLNDFLCRTNYQQNLNIQQQELQQSQLINNSEKTQYPQYQQQQQQLQY